MLLNNDDKAKAVSLFVDKTKAPEGEEPVDGEPDGQLMASESIISAFQAGDAQKLNQGLKDWMDMYAGSEDTYGDDMEMSLDM